MRYERPVARLAARFRIESHLTIYVVVYSSPPPLQTSPPSPRPKCSIPYAFWSARPLPSARCLRRVCTVSCCNNRYITGKETRVVSITTGCEATLGVEDEHYGLLLCGTSL